MADGSSSTMTARIISELYCNKIWLVRNISAQFSSYIRVFVFIQTIEFRLIRSIAGRCSDSEINCGICYTLLLLTLILNLFLWIFVGQLSCKQLKSKVAIVIAKILKFGSRLFINWLFVRSGDIFKLLFRARFVIQRHYESNLKCYIFSCIVGTFFIFVCTVSSHHFEKSYSMTNHCLRRLKSNRPSDEL